MSSSAFTHALEEKPNSTKLLPRPPKRSDSPGSSLNWLSRSASGGVAFRNEPAAFAVEHDFQNATVPCDPIVAVKGSNDVEYQNMISVLDVLQQLDIAKVGLATEAGN